MLLWFQYLKRGGEISEGIIGSPCFINPVLANTDQDKDLSMLVYMD